ncbi:hypothetical protein [Marivirga sp.]|uniref:hypothetical protein n=1 Tax=Marivirga sp. TaxID=2018662 RepID=UPI002D7F825E|nr:hypothetical protein [Marivirga sp.]HET8858829.1 hypothetical protein [Marivirga sp.]
MKRNFKNLGLLALVFTVILGACKPDPAASPEDEKLQELTATWNIVDVNVEADLSGGVVAINIDGNNLTYSVTNLNVFTDANLNHDGILETSGTFELSSNLDVITLNNGGTFRIMALDKETGDLTLSYDAPFPKAKDDAQPITLTLEIQE